MMTLKVVFEMALRNLFLHRGKTLVLGLIIAVGLFVLMVGNSLMDTITVGLEKTYTRSFTADLAVVPAGEGPQSLFPSAGGGGTVSPLVDYTTLAASVVHLPGVKAVSPQLNTRAQISVDEREGTGTLVAGIDPQAYRKVFPDGLKVVEGNFLEPGQEGVLVTQRTRDLLRDLGMDLRVGQSVVLTNRNPATGFKAREVTVRGIVRFDSDNSLVQRMTLADISTARILAGLSGPAPTSESSVPQDSTDPEAAFLNLGSLEGPPVGAESSPIPGTSVVDRLDALLSGPPGPHQAPDPQTWTFLLVRLDQAGASETVAAEIRHLLGGGEKGRVQDWVATVGPLAEVVVNLRWIFNALVLVVGLVALLVITNSLVISVTERVPEIGTIRALGGQRGFVRALITTETLVTSLVFGVLGIAMGAVVLVLSGLVGLRAPNEIVATLIGGPVLRPWVSLGALAQSLGLVVVVGLLASVYPVTVALRISPVRAMQSN